jgi:hypothetical protein
MRRVKKIYAALERKGALGRYWLHPDFDCFAPFAKEVREIMATVAVESELSNGGPSQLLWNCKAHWRTLLDLAESGYRRFGPKAVFPEWEPKLETFQRNQGAKGEDVGKWWLEADKKISVAARLDEFPFEEAEQDRERYLVNRVDRLVDGIKKTRLIAVPNPNAFMRRVCRRRSSNESPPQCSSQSARENLRR